MISEIKIDKIRIPRSVIQLSEEMSKITGEQFDPYCLCDFLLRQGSHYMHQQVYIDQIIDNLAYTIFHTDTFSDSISNYQSTPIGTHFYAVLPGYLKEFFKELYPLMNISIYQGISGNLLVFQREDLRIHQELRS